MAFHNFIARLRIHSPIDEGDARALEAIAGQTRRIAAGSFATRDGESPTTCSLLNYGLAVNHKIVGSGGRQIVGMFLAGELLDFDGLFLETIDFNIQAISDCEVTLFQCPDMLRVLFERPAIGKALLRDNAIRAAISREWMTNLGRRDSTAKVAHLLCEISLRLTLSGDASDDCFELPINQEQIADIIGVTTMHVGRVLRTLEAEKIIIRQNRVINIIEKNRLRSIGDFSPTYLQTLKPESADSAHSS